MAAPSLIVEVRPGGLFVPALDLWLDPSREVPRAFVSHAHGDHAGGTGSGTVFASPETLSLIAARQGAVPGEVPIGWDESVELAIPREQGGGTARVSIAPAGHVLGAAQLVIDHPGGRFVYTGDYRTGAGATHATGAPIACDTLAIETTFGLPIFSFPERGATVDALVAWCRSTLASGETPVLLAYALGKAQSLVHALFAAGFESVIAHGAVHRVAAAYEALGRPMGVADGRLKAYVEEKKRGLSAPLVVPPNAIGLPLIKKRVGVRVAYVSGFALLDAALEQHRADEGFALSDHADFDDLMSVVTASGARFVYATHGEAAPFAELVRARGVACEALQVHAIDEREETAS